MKPEKAERRDKRERNRRKMVVTGRSVKRLLEIIQQRASKLKESGGDGR